MSGEGQGQGSVPNKEPAAFQNPFAKFPGAQHGSPVGAEGLAQRDRLEDAVSRYVEMLRCAAAVPP